MAEAVLNCLADAGLDDLSAVEHGMASYESDHFNLQMTLGAILQDTLGLRPKPSVRIEGGGATGILQAIEVTQQLWGTVDPRRQVKDARRGLTDTHAGIASISVVNIFERRD